MRIINLHQPQQQVSFCDAVLQGAPANGGSFFVETLPRMDDIPALLQLGFLPRSVKILQTLLGDEWSISEIQEIVTAAFNFPLPVSRLTERIAVAELFHGPTLAFKDFGARFLAQVLRRIMQKKQLEQALTILTATSGDTGAAVAHAFYQIPGIQVCVLYPQGRIAPLQEQLFCTLGENVRAFEVHGSFDDCQRLVKQCFVDEELNLRMRLTSANSINIARLYAQCCYYFEAVARCQRPQIILAVPSGNFGNLTAGLMAQKMGLPVKAFVTATNANDTVVEFIRTGVYRSRASVATISNAMDVGDPNNWERIKYLFGGDANLIRRQLRAGSLSDEETREAMRDLFWRGELMDPHSAVAFRVLERHLAPDEDGLFLATAHPAKFQQVVEETLGCQVQLPLALAQVQHKKKLSEPLENDFAQLKQRLLTIDSR